MQAEIKFSFNTLIKLGQVVVPTIGGHSLFEREKTLRRILILRIEAGSGLCLRAFCEVGARVCANYVFGPLARVPLMWPDSQAYLGMDVVAENPTQTTKANRLASFVARVSYNDISETAREELKLRILDALGCAIGALEGEPIEYLREQIGDFGGAKRCTMIGGGMTSPDRAAFYNSALVRYLDFNDSYLAKGETCHPSDNFGAMLAVAEYANASGSDLLTALALAYQVQCRLSDVAPVRAKGFDHTTQGSYALAAGISKALGLDETKTANAIAICGTAFNALRVTRTGALSHWKGLAYPNTAFCCTHAVFLAKRGVTGPPEVFKGNKGFQDAIAGKFEIDWTKEDLERVRLTSMKKFNAEFHSQSAIEGALELREEHDFHSRDIEEVKIAIFDVAYHIIGGGEEGSKTVVRIKEEADHSLPYMVAVALLDGQVLPPQYEPERIRRDDVQNLLQRIVVRPDESCSNRFPGEHACNVSIRLKNGETLTREKSDYEGFHTKPMSWEAVSRKFEKLSEPYTTVRLRNRIIKTVRELESHSAADLARLLAKVSRQTKNLN